MESNSYTRWSKLLSRCSSSKNAEIIYGCPNDSQDNLDKVQLDYMRRLNERHELITGRCFDELIWRSSEEITIVPVEPTL
jgi:hypothetical protein